MCLIGMESVQRGRHSESIQVSIVIFHFSHTRYLFLHGSQADDFHTQHIHSRHSFWQHHTLSIPTVQVFLANQSHCILLDCPRINS